MHWKAELELAFCDNELDLLMFQFDNDDDLTDTTILSPSITHLSFQGKLLHAFHFVLSFFEGWVSAFKFR